MEGCLAVLFEVEFYGEMGRVVRVVLSTKQGK